MVERSADLPTLCSALIDLANERGGPDNVTVVAVRFEGEGLPAPDGGDGAGYQVYHVSDPDSTDTIEPTTTVEATLPPSPPPPAAQVVAESLHGTRWNGLLVAAAVIALILLILTVAL
jgi:protein phosphatase